MTTKKPLPRLEIVYKDTDELIPYARNARTHSEEQVTQIASSIREFGFRNPIILDGENGVIAGHGRLMAAKKLGLDKVPCIECGDLTKAQKRAYVLADNQIGLNSSWDKDLLKVELEDLHESDFDLGLTGFSASELEKVLYGESLNGGSIEDDETPEEFDSFDEQKLAHKCPKCGFEFD